jgi:hypothetical protein
MFVIYELIRKGSVAKLRCSVCKYFCILYTGFLLLFPDPVYRFLFLEQVRRVGEKVASLGRVPIIWDDMLRTISKSDIM